MASFQDLINVTFQDLTSHTYTDTSDVLGCVINHFWGPVNTLNVMDAASFRNYYPNYLPVGTSEVVANNYYSFTQVLKALDLGMDRVEVYRPQGGWMYSQVNISDAGTVSVTQSPNQFSPTAAVSIALKYPGYIPQSLAPNYANVSIETSISDGVITIKVKGKLEDSDADNYYVLETWEGTFGLNDTTDGFPTYISKVVEQSSFIAVQVNQAISTSITVTSDLPKYSSNTDSVFSSQDFQTVCDDYFSDIELSDCTLIISPFADDSGDDTIINLARKRMDCNAIVGYPTTQTFNWDSIHNFFNGLQRDKFSFFVAGRESITVFGATVQSNCVGGWCGATANIAKTVRLNQLASARTYGAYSGTLTASLKFDDVLTAHELGVISVYQSKVGPQIFGVRSLNQSQTSYFGKANVMRVLASILKNIFPICIDAIHTDAAANARTRTQFQTRFQSVIDLFISQQNLQAQSTADCGEQYNNDTLSKGGTIFNLVLTLWFIGLVEKVNIKVVATDSSVSAEII